MQNIGERLREAREEKNLSLDTVYKQTKIYPHVLEALEQDRADIFLNVIYIKGFLKTYAEYLGLDSEKLVQEYLNSRKKQTPASQPTFAKKTRAFTKLNKLMIVRVVAGLALFLVFIFYFRFVVTRIPQSAQQTNRPKVTVKAAKSLPGASLAQERTKEAVLPGAEDLILEIRTKNNCWLRVKCDNQSVFEKTLPKGKTERWRAKEKIELLIGKPEALELFLNGEAINLKTMKVKRGLVITHAAVKAR